MEHVKTVENLLVKYVRDKNNNPRGVVVAIGAKELGYALAHKGDKFDKARGLQIAVGRALKHATNVEFPESLQDAKAEMLDRSVRYFK